jgi:hypothetical protein
VSAARNAVKIGGEELDAAGIDVVQGLLAAQNVQRGAALGAGLCQDESPVRKIEREKRLGGRRVWLAADASADGRQS